MMFSSPSTALSTLALSALLAGCNLFTEVESSSRASADQADTGFDLSDSARPTNNEQPELEVVFEQAPEALSYRASANFQVSCTSPPCDYQCEHVGVDPALAPCSTNFTLEQVGMGLNRIRVEATDLDGRQATGTYDWELTYHNTIATTSFDGRVRKLDPDGNLIWMTPDHGERLGAAAVDPDGFIYTVGRNSPTVYKFDTYGELVWRSSGQWDAGRAVAVDREGNVYVAAQPIGIQAYDADGGFKWNVPIPDTPYFVTVGPSGFIYGTSNTGNVHRITAEGEEEAIISLSNSNIRRLAVSDNGTFYAGLDNNSIRTYSSIGEEMSSYTGHTESIYGIALQPSPRLFSASRDATLRSLSTRTLQELWSFEGFEDRLDTVTVDIFGNAIGGARDGTVRKISADGSQIWSFSDHEGNVQGVAVDPGVYPTFAEAWEERLDSAQE